jgi:hypothetical protein
MGVRTGNLEIFNAASDLPSWGAPAELHAGWRRQVVDGQHPLHRDRRRIRLAENEAFGDPRMMPGTEHPWFVTQVTLKTLQLDLNWISVQPCTWQLNPALLRWARTCLGSTAATSPDAWVALRTWEDPTWRVDEADARRIAADARLPAGARAWHSTGRWPLRYWERFLSCRHVPPDASPVPCAPPELPIDAATMELRWGRSWEACRTAVAQGQRALALAVDPAFAANLGPRLRVLVTARGSGPARWRLVYDRGPGREPGRSAMQEQSADRFTTTTIAIADADLRQGLPGGVDLRLEVEGLHDLAFRLVRLVRVDPPPLP